MRRPIVTGKLRGCYKRSRHGVWRPKARHTEEEARAAAAAEGGRTRAYRCPLCRSWHIGHSPT